MTAGEHSFTNIIICCATYSQAANWFKDALDRVLELAIVNGFAKAEIASIRLFRIQAFKLIAVSYHMFCS